MGLFTPATPDQRRLKLYVYGDSGTGKTVTSLYFPKPAVVDLDGGCAFYTKAFQFNHLRTTDIDKVTQAVDELIKDPAGNKTLVIDSMTKYWELLQEKHLKRLRVKKGNSQYALQPLDYKAIKGDLKSFINKLLALDLNIVATAQSKKVYATDTTEFMKVIGSDPDSERNLPYMFDVVLELQMGPDGDSRIAKVIKDRTNTLPKTFDYTYQELVKYFGIKELEREPVQLRAVQELNKVYNRNTKITLNGKDLLTAGVGADTLTKLAALTKNLSDEDLRDKLNEDYSAQSLLDLREDEARTLVSDLESKIQK